jgi:hypothetical protein
MEVEHLVRQRSVGAWFLDHLDNPLEANLPLFPPNIEARMLGCGRMDDHFD